MKLISLLSLHPSSPHFKELAEDFQREMASDLQPESEAVGSVSTVVIEGFERHPLQAVLGTQWEDGGGETQEAIEEWVEQRAPKVSGFPWVVVQAPQAPTGTDQTWVWLWDGHEISLKSYFPEKFAIEKISDPYFLEYETSLMPLKAAAAERALDDTWPKTAKSPTKPRM